MKKLILIILILSIQQSIGQNFNDLVKKIKVSNLDNIKQIALYKNVSFLEQVYLQSQVQLIKNGRIDSVIFYKAIHTTPKQKKNNVLKNIIIGDFYLYSKIPKDSLSLDLYKKALNYSLKINDTLLITESFKKILKQLSQNRSANELSSTYIYKYSNYLYDKNEVATYTFFKSITEASIENIEKISPLKKGLSIANKTENVYLKAKYNQMIGVFNSYFKKNIDSALVYMHNAKKLLESKPYQCYKNELCGIYGNIGQYEDLKGNYNIARDYYNKASRIKVPKYRYIVKVKLNEILAKNARKRNLKDSAYYYLQQSNLYKDTLNEFNKGKALYDLEKKYKTIEKEKKILKLEKNNLETDLKRKQNRNFLTAALLFIFLAGTIGILYVKNATRKRKLAEQQKELEKQKNITFLKEQELTTINAMIDGQEKERKRIAEDLHDNLGSVLATLKLHFENLKMNHEKKKMNQEILFDKTENLIDEAYLKVRSIAHAKNAGVIANQGLLVAIQIMAEKISSADKIKIEVIDFGLQKHLENSLEISVFRIIQELITNILKHADAKNATINISFYDKNLNIIIEDDGKGFDIKKVNLKNGMGICSIKTRVNHLKGTFKVDSTIGKGCSIIIDIPVY